ncbi:MAG: hypothetical protein OEW66_06985, partial [Actinomycetota bacterium]|nr:hypothetical protein [Actinomycetota bacterium]
MRPAGRLAVPIRTAPIVVAIAILAALVPLVAAPAAFAADAPSLVPPAVPAEIVDAVLRRPGVTVRSDDGL